jgi:hypothetical protein
VFRPEGVASASSNTKTQAVFLEKYISEHDVGSAFDIIPLAAQVFVPNVHFNAFSASDKKYALAWMFKYAGNPAPPAGFTDTEGNFDWMQYNAYVAQVTAYKLANHYQVKYFVDENGFFKVIPDKPKAEQLWSAALIGSTNDPSHFSDVSSVPNTIAQFLGFPANGVFAGQSGDNNDWVGKTTDTTTKMRNEGRPDQKALNAFKNLTGQDQGYIWSTITFFSDLQWYAQTTSPSNGKSLTRDPIPQEVSAPRINTQIYPTYWMYMNGVKSDDVQNQAPEPSALFPNTDRAQ